MAHAIIFSLIIVAGYILAIIRGPFYGLLTYAVIYFVNPTSKVNWWSYYLPFSRWSLITSCVLILSFFFHRDKLINRGFKSVHWLFSFILLTIFIILFTSGDHEDVSEYTYKLITYAITIWFIIKTIKTFDQFKTFIFYIVLLAGYLSFKAYLVGDRIHGRLENIGANDSVGSNEFGLLLAGVMPFMFPFIIYGKWYERFLCVLALPFIFNAFILCNSRGAAVALGLGVIYTILIIADKKLRKILLISVICIIPLFIYLMDSEYVERISTLKSTDEAIEDSQSINQLSSGRTEIWRYGMKMVLDHPFGAGPNGFKHLARYYLPPEMLNYRTAEYGVRSAHNTYLQVLVEQGFLGFLIWGSMCIHNIFILRSSAINLRLAGMSRTFLGISVLALNMSFITSLAGGLVGSRLYYEFFWWQVALSVVIFSFTHNINMEKEYSNQPGNGTNIPWIGMHIAR